MVRQIAAAVDRRAPWDAQIRQAVEAWIAVAQSDLALTLSWIRDLPALGADARHLQREWLEAFIVLIEDLAAGPGLRAAGVTPPSRQLMIMLLGGLRELIATTGEDGGDIGGITEVAVQATQALLGPRARQARVRPARRRKHPRDTRSYLLVTYGPVMSRGGTGVQAVNDDARARDGTRLEAGPAFSAETAAVVRARLGGAIPEMIEVIGRGRPRVRGPGAAGRPAAPGRRGDRRRGQLHRARRPAGPLDRNPSWRNSGPSGARRPAKDAPSTDCRTRCGSARAWPGAGCARPAPRLDRRELSRVGEAVFGYLDDLAAACARGYAEARVAGRRRPAPPAPRPDPGRPAAPPRPGSRPSPRRQLDPPRPGRGSPPPGRRPGRRRSCCRPACSPTGPPPTRACSCRIRTGPAGRRPSTERLRPALDDRALDRALRRALRPP